MAESRRKWGGFSSSILVLMVILLLSSDQHCAAEAVKKNMSIGNQCGGSNKEECLLSDNVEMEFLLDSEASTRVLATTNEHPTNAALLDYKAVVFCGRPNSPPNCTPPPNTGPKIHEHCNTDTYNKDCYRL